MKEFWKSKTFWVNSLTVLGGMATMMAGNLASGGTISVLGLINIILRTFTNTELVLKK